MNPEELIEALVDEIRLRSSDYNDGLDGWLSASFDGEYLTVFFEEAARVNSAKSKATWKLIEVD